MGSLAWQASLFDEGVRPEPDRGFAGLRRIPLDPDGRSWVDHCPGWLRGADALFAELLAAGRWQQRRLWMYDKVVAEPRLTAGWAVDPAAAERTRDWSRYVREEEPGDEDDDGRAGAGDAATPAPLREMAALLSGRYGVEFDSIWVNLYRDGRDSVAWHGDRNARSLRNPLVATVTLGATRDFLLRRKGTGAIAHRLRPATGDLLVMGGACQHEWEHTVPKTAKPVGPRMSVTIRHSR